MGANIVRTVALALFSLLALPTNSQAEDPCLPPGVTPEVLSWQSEAAQSIAMRTESGVVRHGLVERSRADDGRSTVIVWVRGAPVYVDTAPDNPAMPAWVDAGRLAADGKLLLDRPGAPCQWRRVGGSQAGREPRRPAGG
jgi:hypothetical protein